MKEFKASTKRGQQLLGMGNTCCFKSLKNLYDHWSVAKEHAFNWCLNEYYNDENSTGFGVGNANSFGFTASWLLTKDGEDAMRIETKGNSYLVWLNR